MNYFLTIFLFITSLAAQELSTRYDVHVSIFDHVGYADVTLKEDGKNYEIKLVATTIGTAATLLRDRVDTYISKGKIREGRYIPDIFTKIKETTKKSRTQTYYFNHDKKEIKLIEEKTKIVSRPTFNTKNFEIEFKEAKEHSKKEKIEENYTNNDTLSAYLNTKLDCNAMQKKHDLVAMGAHNEKNRVTISYLDERAKQKAKENFSKEIEHLYNLNITPFDKSESVVDVLVSFDNDGFLKEAFMGEVFWVGKISAKRVHHKIAAN